MSKAQTGKVRETNVSDSRTQPRVFWNVRDESWLKYKPFQAVNKNTVSKYSSTFSENKIFPILSTGFCFRKISSCIFQLFSYKISHCYTFIFLPKYSLRTIKKSSQNLFAHHTALDGQRNMEARLRLKEFQNSSNTLPIDKSL